MFKVKNIIFDLDGTLADNSGRLHLLPPPEERHKDSAWDAFNLACEGDKPISDNIKILRSLSKDPNNRVVIVTGRGEVAREATEYWLFNNDILYSSLFMRKIGDCRPDTEVKREVYELLGLESIVCVFEDLTHMVDFTRSLGLTCHQVTQHKELRVDTTPQVVTGKGGMKFDSGKPRVDLLFSGMPMALEGVAKTLTMGAEKYAENSWQTVPDGFKRYCAAMLRHLLAYNQGELVDKESGFSHLDHVATNALFISELEKRGAK